jgi:hypothetical protein
MDCSTGALWPGPQKDQPMPLTWSYSPESQCVLLPIGAFVSSVPQDWHMGDSNHETGTRANTYEQSGWTNSFQLSREAEAAGVGGSLLQDGSCQPNGTTAQQLHHSHKQKHMQLISASLHPKHPLHAINRTIINKVCYICFLLVSLCGRLCVLHSSTPRLGLATGQVV